MTSTQLLAAIQEFTTTILNPYDLPELLHRVTGHAAAVTDAQGAGIMLDEGGELAFAAASHQQVTELERLEGQIHTGASHDAFASCEAVVIDDLRADAAHRRWPEYAERALGFGYGAVLSIPMIACGQTIGVLTIYRTSAGSWDPELIEAAKILTGMGSGYILHASELRAQHTLTDQLSKALENRDVIGQAKGILMARHQVDADEAFDMLRSLSQSTNVKLRDLARTIVASGKTLENTN